MNREILTQHRNRDWNVREILYEQLQRGVHFRIWPVITRAVAVAEFSSELERAGAFAVVLESVPAELGGRVSAALRIPTVGIGAGPECDAQILVWQDMAGLTAGRLPRFVKPFGDMRADLLTAARQYVSEVAAGSYPDRAHSYA